MQCDVCELRPSPSGSLLAFAVDGSGYETYSIRMKNLRTGIDLDEMLRDTVGTIAWADDETLFYVKLDT